MNVSATDCFHCGLPNPPDTNYQTAVFDNIETMCCPGCLAVTEAIVEHGLTDYYKFRTAPAAKAEDGLEEQAILEQLSIFDAAELQADFVADEGQLKSVQLTLEGITCAACGWLIERHLSKVAGISQNSVNVSTARAMVKWDPTQISLSEILKQFAAIGYTARPFSAEEHEQIFQEQHKRFIKQLGLAGLMTMQVMMLSFGFYFDWLGNIDETMAEYFHWISLVLTTPVVFYSGSTFYLGAIRALLARGVNMDLPVSIAILGTYFAGIKAVIFGDGDVYFESICMFIFFLLSSRFLEHRARYQATEIASNSMQYIPLSAHLIQANQNTEIVLAKQLKPNQTVLVKAGDTIPVDGVIIEGTSFIEESMLTGEFVPVSKAPGEKVFGGTLNQAQPLQIMVTQTLEESLVNKIARLQESAMSHKPKVAQMADQLSQYFVFAVLFISTVTFFTWTYFGNDNAFWITVSILIATCPCALGLATPSALTTAMARLQKAGVLIKRADTLERITKVNHIVFDKTGTLTTGAFSIAHTWYSDETHKNLIDSIVASIEQFSEHPIARAFECSHPISVKDVKVVINQGILGEFEGALYRIGNAKFMPCAIPNHILNATVFVSKNEQVIAAYWLTDALKVYTTDVVSALADAYSLSIISGDAAKHVSEIAETLNIKEAHHGCRPEDKLSILTELQSSKKVVMMLGDGINDAPVLAQADVAVTVGNASDFTKHSTDVILLQEHLAQLPLLTALAAKTKRTIKQNFMWALGYNVLVLPFAIMGVLTPWQAALGMSLSSLIVVYNSARLLRFRQHN